MKLISRFIMSAVIFSSLFCQDQLSEDKISHRPPTVAGAFYPAKADELRSMITNYLNEQKPIMMSQEIIAIVVPHAGYVYSGKVAAYAYRELQGKKYDAIIIITPSHHKYFKGASVFKGDAYTTPLGVCKVDKSLSEAIGTENSSVKLSFDGHTWQDSVNEHSLEVQLPFLQVVLPDVPIVPIVMGTQDMETTNKLVNAIVKSVSSQNKKVLIVASSDLSHFHSLQEARSIDRPIMLAFQRYDYFKLSSMFFSRNLEACGGGPIVTAMIAAEHLGANNPISLKYSTSADVPAGKDNPERVVGYFAGVIQKSTARIVDLALPSLEESDKQEVLDIAEHSVEKSVIGDSSKFMIEMMPVQLTDYYTGFVTLKKKGELRACMGHLFPTDKLFKEIDEVARVAARNDYRFGAVRKNELKDLEYEISILSRFKLIQNTDEIKPGEHGLYIRLKDSSGLLLPQVASERGWDTKTFLENTCMKAGLPKDAYLNPDAEIYIFKALIIN